MDTAVAVIGAGPYGLATSAHLGHKQVDLMSFGSPMTTWQQYMPAGMLLKSDGFATSLCAPVGGWTLGDYCSRAGEVYGDREPRVPLQRFIDYGLSFQREFVPDLDSRSVTQLAPAAGGYSLTLEDGDVLTAERVVLAVGITHFASVPSDLAGLGDRVSHSSEHRLFDRFGGQRVAVVGAGSSAVEVAAGLIGAGADVTILARRAAIPFWSAPQPEERRRSLLQRMREPSSGLGPGWRSRLCQGLPDVFRQLPADVRLKVVRNHLGPSSGWWLKDQVTAGAEIRTGTAITSARLDGDRVVLTIACAAGGSQTLGFDHVVAATGYHADVDRLSFVDSELRARIQRVGKMPQLTRGFECSVPGLYFVGAAAAGTFGPLLRFVVGSEFTAPRVAAGLARCSGRRRQVRVG